MEIPAEELNVAINEARKERLLKIFKLSEKMLDESYVKCMSQEVHFFSPCLWKGIFGKHGILRVLIIFVVLAIMGLTTSFVFEFMNSNEVWNNIPLSFLTLSFIYSFFVAVAVGIGSAIPLKKISGVIKNYYKFFSFSFMYLLGALLIWFYLVPVLSVRVIESYGAYCLSMPDFLYHLPNGAGFTSILLIILFFWIAYRFFYSPAFVSLLNMGVLDQLVYSFQLTKRCGECFTVFVEFLVLFLFSLYILYISFSPENPWSSSLSILFGAFLLSIAFSAGFSLLTLSAVKELKNWKNQ